MNKKFNANRIIFFMFFLFFIGLVIVCPSKASDVFRLDEVLDRPYIDSDKTWVDDKQRCWAHAISNAVSFITGMPTKEVLKNLREIESRDISFDVFTAMRALLKKWGVSKNVELITVDATSKKQTTNLGFWIIGALLKHEVVIATITSSDKDYSHAITIYGFEADKNNLYLYYVNSDDFHKGVCKEQIIKHNGLWWFVGDGPFGSVGSIYLKLSSSIDNQIY